MLVADDTHAGAFRDRAAAMGPALDGVTFPGLAATVPTQGPHGLRSPAAMATPTPWLRGRAVGHAWAACARAGQPRPALPGCRARLAGAAPPVAVRCRAAAPAQSRWGRLPQRAVPAPPSRPSSRGGHARGSAPEGPRRRCEPSPVLLWLGHRTPHCLGQGRRAAGAAEPRRRQPGRGHARTASRTRLAARAVGRAVAAAHPRAPPPGGASPRAARNRASAAGC